MNQNLRNAETFIGPRPKILNEIETTISGLQRLYRMLNGQATSIPGQKELVTAQFQQIRKQLMISQKAMDEISWVKAAPQKPS